MKKILFIILLPVLIGCYNRDAQIDKDKLTGNDFRLFQDTPAWELAKAVEDENTSKIERIIKTGNVDPDFVEKRFGSTLLALSIMNNKYLSAKVLLKEGANPNKNDNYRGSTPMISAAINDNPEYLYLLLKNGGDPNSKENSPLSKTKDNARTTPLNAAISLSETKTLEKVKLLVEAGADINYSDSDDFKTPSPLSDSFVHKKLDVAFYLLNRGADFKKPLYKMVDGHQVFILEQLRKTVVELDSEDYKIKYQIIELLKEKGLDYNKEPIPDYVLKKIKKQYPKDWKEYLEKY